MIRRSMQTHTAGGRGEGGILSLMALLVSQRNRTPRSVIAVFGLGTFGAALLFGDGMIAPAISAMSTVEGLAVVTSIFVPYTLPLCLAILLGLFHRDQSGGVLRLRVAALFRFEIFSDCNCA
jgi:KUP system potassium uptake protein